MRPALMRCAREAALTVGSILGLVCLLAAAAWLGLGVTPYVVTSGSMAPTIEAGDLVLVRDVAAAQVDIGDVVTVATDGGHVTHRVIAISSSSGDPTLTLQGDANASPDPHAYRTAEAGRVVARLPMAGHVVTALLGPVGLGLCAVLVMVALAVLAGSAGRTRLAAVGTACALCVGAGGLLPLARPSTAYFTDTATLASSQLSAHTVVRPASAQCTSALLAATVSWPADARYDYEVVLRRISTGAVVSTRQVVGTASSVTYTGLSDFGLIVGAGTVDFRVEVRSRLANAPTWTSANVRTYSAIRVLAIVIGATATCTT